MEKKRFIEITRSVFTEYGFVVDGNYFYIDLPEVYIVAWLTTAYNTYHLGYNFSIKAIHDKNEIIPKDAFSGYDSILINMAKPKGDIWLEYKEMDEKYYTLILKKMLSKYFDPYKKNALEFIKKATTEIGLIEKGDVILLKEKAQQFLGLN